MTDGSAPPNDPGLIVIGLAKAWAPGRTPVFADVDFSLSRTGRLALLGRTGQGKSTLS